jgi:thioredoxin 1
MISTSDATFEQDVLNADKPVVVDFWAEWCGPCKTIAPILEDLSQAYDGSVTIAKLNIDDNPRAPQTYGIRGIPTLMLFRNGQVAATKVGAVSKNELKDWIDQTVQAAA